MNTSVLVIGGAGKFGSDVAKAAAEAGCFVISADNLSTGDQSRLTFGPLVRCSDHEVAKIARTISEYKIQHVFQCAMDANSTHMSTIEKSHRAVSAALHAIQLAQMPEVLSLTIFQKESENTELVERVLQDCAPAIKKSLTLIKRPLTREILNQKIQMTISDSHKGE